MTDKESFVRGVQLPEQTSSYVPVGHGELLDMVRDKMEAYDMSFESTDIKTDKKGNKMMVNFDTQIDQTSSDLLGRLSVTNSYDKSKPLTFNTGTCIKICSNGAFAEAEKFMNYTRKHTKKVYEEIDEKMDNAIQSLKEHIDQIENFKQRAVSVNIDKKQMSEIAGELFIKEELIASQQMSVLKDEIIEPSFDDFKYENAWSLYNHITYAISDSRPMQYVKNHRNIHTFFEQNLV